VEQGAEELLSAGAEGDVALLVVGDPFGATTHTDLVLRKCLIHVVKVKYLRSGTSKLPVYYLVTRL
jgi:diphthamide biosynthesis methyltransferase